MKTRGTGARVRVFAALSLLALMMPSTAGTAAQTDPLAGDAPVPVMFPRDDGPHNAPIEWWYYTGHLFAANGDRYGFEYVTFRGRRGLLTGHVAHVAVTDAARGEFRYDQRSVGAPRTLPATPGFDLAVGDWRMRGAGGTDRLRAAVDGYAFDLRLTTEKPPALHDGDGYVDYGNGTGSYYYSRTRMEVTGSLLVDGEARPVTGEAWMDHQWGNFSTFSVGGWDWFSVQLDDGSDLMLYLVKDAAGNPTIVDGSLIAADGSLTVLEPSDFVVTATAEWTSARSGATYPAAWTVTVPAADLELRLEPTVPDQELETIATTEVIYWEGEVTVVGTRGGDPIAGLGYVELTGYAGPGGGGV